MSDESKYSKEATLFDRIAIGSLSAVLAAITYVLMWSSFALFSRGYILPIEIFWFFTGAMFLLGFLTLDNYYIEILAPIWHFLVKIFG